MVAAAGFCYFVFAELIYKYQVGHVVSRPRLFRSCTTAQCVVPSLAHEAPPPLRFILVSSFVVPPSGGSAFMPIFFSVSFFSTGKNTRPWHM